MQTLSFRSCNVWIYVKRGFIKTWNFEEIIMFLKAEHLKF